MDLLPSDALTLFHDPALNLLYHRWQGTHNMHLFRPAVQQIKQLLQDLGVEYWIVDLNGLPNIGLEDQIWISNQVLPHVAKLPHLRQLALVLSTNVYNQLAAESILYLGQEFMRLEVQFFSDFDGAFDWLINPTGDEAVPFMSLHHEWPVNRISA